MKTINDSQIQSVLQLFSTIHKEAWLVGGCVRDMRHTNRTEAWYCNRSCTG